jgi:hypothetical protein
VALSLIHPNIVPLFMIYYWYSDISIRVFLLKICKSEKSAEHP